MEKSSIGWLFFMKEEFENHLDVFADRYELHQKNGITVYHQGPQNNTTQERYEKINTELANGYLDNVMENISSVNFSKLSLSNRDLLRNLVNGITSEVGRALVGLTFLQLTVKSIYPEQSIRLHKGTIRNGSFSWTEGISMRTIDSTYCTPFLRKNGLLNVNKYGVFMTRSLAENYPYTSLYKAEMRGPFAEWISIVDAVEANVMPAKLGLCYLIGLLQNKSDSFKESAENACLLAANSKLKTFDEIKYVIERFFNKTCYSARAFEVAIHSFLQALKECGYLAEYDLTPISQMRSANKKHHNIGDVELTHNKIIVEAWDAKYGKPYLRDELEELRDKLLSHPEIKVAGFIVNVKCDLREDIVRRIKEISLETEAGIYLLSFDEWLSFQTKNIEKAKQDAIAEHWLCALVESFAQKRPETAPIDEPCDEWINDIIKILQN